MTLIDERQFGNDNSPAAFRDSIGPLSHLRENEISEELMDIVSGVEAQKDH